MAYPRTASQRRGSPSPGPPATLPIGWSEGRNPEHSITTNMSARWAFRVGVPIFKSHVYGAGLAGVAAGHRPAIRGQCQDAPAEEARACKRKALMPMNICAIGQTINFPAYLADSIHAISEYWGKSVRPFYRFHRISGMNTQRHKTQKAGRSSFASLAVILSLFFPVWFEAQAAGLTLPPVVNLRASATQEEIQAALDGLPEGGEVVLAAGTYEITQPLMLRHDSETLRGMGLDTVLHLADKANCPVVILGAPMVAPQKATAHLHLANLLINGNRLNQQAEFWHSATDGSQLNNNGIDIWDVNDSTVDGVVCRSCRSGGMVTASTRRLMVHDFTAYDNQFDGLACYLTEESHFKGLHLYDNLAAGISLDLAFNNNVITDATLSGNDLGVFMRNSRDNSFQGVTISKSRNHGVFMAQGFDGKLDPGTECTGNNFEGLTITNCGGDAFLVNDLSCKNNLIRDARFVDNIHGSLAEPSENLVKVEELLLR